MTEMEIRYVCTECSTGSFRIVEVEGKTYLQCKKCGHRSEVSVPNGVRPWRL
jgi:DNA-directed RNA polymerase subunit RPC12/RpoP